MWSLGCILGELISYSNPYRSKESIKAGLAIFKGSSCFPLSPYEAMQKNRDKKAQVISKNDQLNVILESLGPQTKESLEFIDDKAALDYVH